MHSLIGDNTTCSWFGGIVLEWFKQKLEIFESKRFLPRANCKDKTTRLFWAESILERYVKDQSTIKVIDDARMLF